MENFTPYSGFLGGISIGLGTILLLLADGRIAGISGIVGGLLAPNRGDVAWRILFIAGLWIGAIAYTLVRGESPTITLQVSWPMMALAGFLVGFGTRMGGGCTSGHAVCGIARFSKRSIVATLVFLLSAVITVFIARHVIGA